MPRRACWFRLLCTDGLTAQADEAEIAGVLSAFADPDQAAAGLVRLANRNWGDDNTAVVVAEQAGELPPQST